MQDWMRPREPPSGPVRGDPRYTPPDFDPTTSREPPKLDLVARRLSSGVSLRRSRADWPIVARGRRHVHPRGDPARGRRHVRRRGRGRLPPPVLADAPPVTGGIEVTRVGRRGPGPMRPTRRPRRRSRRRFGPVRGRIVRTATIRLVRAPGPAGGGVRDLAMFGYAEGIDEHATHRRRRLAGRRRHRRNGQVPVAVSEQRRRGARPAGRPATSGWRAGSIRDSFVPRPGRRHLPHRRSGGSVLAGRAAGARGRASRADGSSRQRPVHDDAAETSSTRTHRDPGRPRLARDPRLRLRSTLADVDPLGCRSRGPARASRAARRGELADVTRHDRPAGDPGERTGQSLLVSRAGVLVLTIQLVILAVYAVLLSAALLDRASPGRHDDAPLARGRHVGGSPGWPQRRGCVLDRRGRRHRSVAGARRRSTLFDLVGPLADIGLRLDPAVGVRCVRRGGRARAALPGRADTAGLPCPHGRWRGVQGGMARGQTRGVGQRLGLDLALLVVAAIGLFQLRQYGGPLTRVGEGHASASTRCSSRHPPSGCSPARSSRSGSSRSPPGCSNAERSVAAASSRPSAPGRWRGVRCATPEPRCC